MRHETETARRLPSLSRVRARMCRNSCARASRGSACTSCVRASFCLCGTSNADRGTQEQSLYADSQTALAHALGASVRLSWLVPSYEARKKAIFASVGACARGSLSTFALVPSRETSKTARETARTRQTAGSAHALRACARARWHVGSQNGQWHPCHTLAVFVILCPNLSYFVIPCSTLVRNDTLCRTLSHLVRRIGQRGSIGHGPTTPRYYSVTLKHFRPNYCASTSQQWQTFP